MTRVGMNQQFAKISPQIRTTAQLSMKSFKLQLAYVAKQFSITSAKTNGSLQKRPLEMRCERTLVTKCNLRFTVKLWADQVSDAQREVQADNRLVPPCGYVIGTSSERHTMQRADF